MQIIPLKLDSVLLLLHNSKLAYYQDSEQRVALHRICASLFLFYVRSRDDLTEIICEEDL